MKFAVYLPNFGAFGDARTLAGLARDAEEAGWDGFFIWDHVARAFVTETVDPWVALAAIALQTERIRIGALVTPLARRRPWKLARETVSVDRLSRGRLVFGAGLGSPGGEEAEWSAFGEETDRRQRAELLDEGLDLLLRLWSGDAVRFEGRHHRVVTESFLPRPLQSPRIPVWLAASWPHRAPLRRAARFDGVFPLFKARPPDDLDELRALLAFVREQRADDDRPFDVVHLVPPCRGDPSDESERIAPYADAGVTWWLERLTPDEFGAEWSSPWPFAAMRERILLGPPIAATS